MVSDAMLAMDDWPGRFPMCIWSEIVACRVLAAETCPCVDLRAFRSILDRFLAIQGFGDQETQSSHVMTRFV